MGVILSFVWNTDFFVSGVWVLAGLGCFVFSVFVPKRILMILALMAGVVLGGWRGGIELIDVKYMAQFEGDEIEVVGKVYEDPDGSGGKMTFRINELRFGGEREVRGSLFVQVSGGRAEVARSDTVRLRGKLSGGFGSFAGSMYRPKVVEILRPEPGDFGLKIREFFAELVRKYIPSPEVDLSLGYLLGARRALPDSLTETLKIVGLTHIVVASGYNLSILVRFSRKVFGKISRFAAMFVSLILIFMFMAITGWTPSMLRAGMVAVLSLLAWYAGRNFHPVKLIFLVAAATLLINPNYIVDLGWILSIASFAGVIIVAPLITAYFYGRKRPNFVARVVLETVAAQIVCLPVLLFFFGSFSLISVVANVLVVPTIPAVMALTFATGIVSFVPFLAQIIGWAATLVLKYHILVIDFFGAQTSFLISFTPETPAVLFLYVPIAAFLIYARQKTGFSLRPVNIVAETEEKTYDIEKEL